MVAETIAFQIACKCNSSLVNKVYMSDDIAINVENLSKVYKLYHSRVDRLKESLHPLRKIYHSDFYALNHVSCKVKKGETVGIIGRNGSGKSTLLKIITGVLTPTSGTVSVNGRISALLELGAGFNPELTGLENVYFNCMLKGYSREEADSKLDAILSFADIGAFIEQPVKTYSSGMFIRLAFAVEAYVDPDIFIVDEALAVGDEAFQRKCFSRIRAIQEKGATILFVSHMLSTTVDLCSRALLFDQGELLISGTPKLIVAKYQKLLYAPKEKVAVIKEELRASASNADSIPDTEQALISAEKQRSPAQEHKLGAFYNPDLRPQSTISYESRNALIGDPKILTINGETVNMLVRGEEYVFTYTVSFDEDAYNVFFGTMLKTVTGYQLGGMVTHTRTQPYYMIEKGSVIQPQFAFRCSLLPGSYFMNAGVFASVNETEMPLHRIVDATMFNVLPEPDLLVTGVVDFSIQSQPADVMRIR